MGNPSLRTASAVIFYFSAGLGFALLLAAGGVMAISLLGLAFGLASITSAATAFGAALYFWGPAPPKYPALTLTGGAALATLLLFVLTNSWM